MNQIDQQVKIVYYTDPLCCWSWAFQTSWERLVNEFSKEISYSYCMGGLISNWAVFNDPLQNIRHPSQMGPLWVEAQQITGVELNEAIWALDPPDSSYPACIAIKAAGLQSNIAAESYLKAIRQAVMIDGQNIADKKVLYSLAKSLADNHPQYFNYEKFRKDFYQAPSLDAFRNDLKKTRFNQITRFPTLTFTNNANKGIIITGYRPYEVLKEALYQVAPHLKKEVSSVISNQPSV